MMLLGIKTKLCVFLIFAYIPQWFSMSEISQLLLHAAEVHNKSVYCFNGVFDAFLLIFVFLSMCHHALPRG